MLNKHELELVSQCQSMLCLKCICSVTEGECIEKVAETALIYRKALEDLTPVLDKNKYAWVYDLLI